MRSYLLEDAGGIDALQLKEVPVPDIQYNEVLIDIKAISINPVDVKVKYSNQGLDMICGKVRPIVLGWDIAGTILRTGELVNGFAAGDRVFGMINFPGHGKAYAENVAAPSEHIAKIPDGVSFPSAAATTLAALTAYQALYGRVNQGDKVLIHAGSGGVGHFAIQIAKSMGAQVATTCSAKNSEFVKTLGADTVIDYKTEDFSNRLSDIQFVLDTQGKDVAEKSLKIMTPGSRLISIAMQKEIKDIVPKAERLGIVAQTMMVKSNGSHMEKLAELLTSGHIKPSIYKTFQFRDLPEAHKVVEAGRTVGKVVVLV